MKQEANFDVTLKRRRKVDEKKKEGKGGEIRLMHGLLIKHRNENKRPKQSNNNIGMTRKRLTGCGLPHFIYDGPTEMEKMNV